MLLSPLKVFNRLQWQILQNASFDQIVLAMVLKLPYITFSTVKVCIHKSCTALTAMHKSYVVFNYADTVKAVQPPSVSYQYKRTLFPYGEENKLH